MCYDQTNTRNIHMNPSHSYLRDLLHSDIMHHTNQYNPSSYVRDPTLKPAILYFTSNSVQNKSLQTTSDYSDNPAQWMCTKVHI